MEIKGKVTEVRLRNNRRYITIEWEDDVTTNESFIVKVHHNAEFEDTRAYFALGDTVDINVTHS